MKELKNEIKKNGYTYLKIMVEQGKKHKVAIYAQHQANSGIIAYEVFIVKTTKEGDRIMPDGNFVHFDASEVFPADESFGKTAWTYQRYVDASRKMGELMLIV